MNNDAIPLKVRAYSTFSQSHTQDKLFKTANDSRYVVSPEKPTFAILS